MQTSACLVVLTSHARLTRRGEGRRSSKSSFNGTRAGGPTTSDTFSLRCLPAAQTLPKPGLFGFRLCLLGRRESVACRMSALVLSSEHLPPYNVRIVEGEFLVFSTLFVLNRSRLPARVLSFLASVRSRISEICAPLCFLGLMFFLCLSQRAAARAQNSPVKVRQSPSSQSVAIPAQADANSAPAKDAAEPGDPLTTDPALAPATLLLQQGKLSEAEASKI